MLFTVRPDLIVDRGDDVAGGVARLHHDVDAALFHDHAHAIASAKRESILMFVASRELTLDELAWFESGKLRQSARRKSRRRRRSGGEQADKERRSRHGFNADRAHLRPINLERVAADRCFAALSIYAGELEQVVVRR